LEGLFDSPPINEEIRKDLEAFEKDKGSEYLFTILEKLDPGSAKRIHPNDSYRLKRALEVWIATGKSLTDHWNEQRYKKSIKYNPFKILINEDRDVLYQRINNRLEQMIETGLVQEIKTLFEKGYKENNPGLTSVGYKEFIPYILRNRSFLECLEEAKKNTRNYAKRQLTWYRRMDFDLHLKSDEIDIEMVFKHIKNHFDL